MHNKPTDKTFYFGALYTYNEKVFNTIINTHFDGNLTFDRLIECIEFINSYLNLMFHSALSQDRKTEYTQSLKCLAVQFNMDNVV